MHDHAGHGHEHGHGHDHRRTRDRRRLLLTVVLTASYMLAEVVGGWLSGSLALLADAGHMLSDVAALTLSLFAIWIAQQRPRDPQRTWGYYRLEVLAALVNGAALLAISGAIIAAAVDRLQAPRPILGPVVTGVALGGLVVNLIALALLNRGRTESVNIRGAWLHVLTDTLGSVGAATAGALVWAFGWLWVDPAVSIVIGLLIIYSAWHLLRDVVSVLMEHAPAHIDIAEVRAALAGTPGVRDVHDLHVWVITSGLEALSCHVVADEGRPPGELLRALCDVLHERFGIDHVTIQIEPEGFVERLPV
ncbi:MAG: cation transporter [Planctomycetes bacterium]|nr:cation transporter [Planctomycetota bacterium]